MIAAIIHAMVATKHEQSPTEMSATLHGLKNLLYYRIHFLLLWSHVHAATQIRAYYGDRVIGTIFTSVVLTYVRYDQDQENEGSGHSSPHSLTRGEGAALRCCPPP